MQSVRTNRPYLSRCDSVGSMLSFDVRSLTSSVSECYVNGQSDVTGHSSRSESDVTNSSDVTGHSSRSESDVTNSSDVMNGPDLQADQKELSADSISIQISNLLDNLQVKFLRNSSP